MSSGITDKEPLNTTQHATHNAIQFESAKEVYQEALAHGEPRHRLAHIAATATGVSIRKVRDWGKNITGKMRENSGGWRGG